MSERQPCCFFFVKKNLVLIFISVNGDLDITWCGHFFFPVFIRFSLHFGRLYAGEPAGEGGWKLGSCPSKRFLVCTVLSEFIFFSDSEMYL